ncbi:4Fe-4S binding protein [Calderihabitans maritimus]|uniref:4Fe-4S ferredoxin n=1 Tax=Calderihabitans maritimus TaxID=1246530 RepID=A0A1Z5HNE0_9FIRM|nr:4Fe-4S binding protein [Calderihabitans maritimus]GAW91024.1 4Fe-4S ferredoxin [Calderihabitans maritimus]
MKVVNLLAQVDAEKCIGCKTCERVCPVLAVKIVDRVAVVDEERCRGCAACEQRCPQYAVTMVKRAEPLVVKVDLEGLDYKEIASLCRKANFNPEQIICYCTATRAEEVAAAILRGAKTPEEISLVTGVRTGCKVECIQPVLRLLRAAGINPEPPAKGWQWYGITVTAWEVPAEVKEKHGKRGFYFDEDIKVLDQVVATATSEERSDS